MGSGTSLLSPTDSARQQNASAMLTQESAANGKRSAFGASSASAASSLQAGTGARDGDGDDAPGALAAINENLPGKLHPRRGEPPSPLPFSDSVNSVPPLDPVSPRCRDGSPFPSGSVQSASPMLSPGELPAPARGSALKGAGAHSASSDGGSRAGVAFVGGGAGRAIGPCAESAEGAVPLGGARNVQRQVTILTPHGKDEPHNAGGGDPDLHGHGGSTASKGSDGHQSGRHSTGGHKSGHHHHHHSHRGGHLVAPPSSAPLLVKARLPLQLDAV